nr:hypothetical protein [Tanacetum cinerariifolium]
SFPCCDNCGGSHETFQCQSIDQNVDFSGSDQIQTPQYPEVHHPYPEIKKLPILLQALFRFFVIKHDQPENSNELFQKLLEDLKELAEYKEFLENSSKEISTSNSNPEKEGPPQDSDIHQLIEECSTEVCEEQKQNMEDTMLELVKICRQKELLCMHDNVDDLIESAFNTKLLSINSQLLDKKEQEVKNVVEQPAERGNRSIESLQNFRVVHKSSSSLNNTFKISSVHAIAPILSTEEPEHSLSMGYEHLSITPETESDEVTESSAKNLLPIPSECEVTSEDENEFKIYSNPLFDEDEINSDKLDPYCFNVKSDVVESLLNRDTFIDSSPKSDFLLKEFSGELAHINLEIKEADFNFEEEIQLNAEMADTIIESLPSLPIPIQDNDSQREEINIITNMDVLPPGFENDESDGEVDAIDDLRDEILVVMNDELECLNPRDKLDDDDYFSFMIAKVFSLLSAENEDTIFDPGISD